MEQVECHLSRKWVINRIHENLGVRQAPYEQEMSDRKGPWAPLIFSMGF
jgi:hypothetical protein